MEFEFLINVNYNILIGFFWSSCGKEGIRFIIFFIDGVEIIRKEIRVNIRGNLEVSMCFKV